MATTTSLRVRYSETDQMGTFYNSRALEWFEVGRTEHLRSIGLPYVEMEARGVMLPLVESHVLYHGRAKYDDELTLTVRCQMVGKARLKFDIDIVQAAGGAKVASGYTIHAITDAAGRPTRPPQWLTEKLTIVD